MPEAVPEAPAPTAAPAPPSPASSSGSGPASGAWDATLTREYRGAYTRSFEASWFAPCDAPLDDALWWVTLTDEALHQRDSLLKALPAPRTEALAVRWRGTASPRMPAGHMGRGTRYLLVTRVLELHAVQSEGACLRRRAPSRAS